MPDGLESDRRAKGSGLWPELVKKAIKVGRKASLTYGPSLDSKSVKTTDSADGSYRKTFEKRREEAFEGPVEISKNLGKLTDYSQMLVER